MKNELNKILIEKFSRQIILKDIGIIGQKKIFSSKVLIIGAGGLGCPVAEYLSRAGIGKIGIVDNDKIELSNIHRQSLFGTPDIGKLKVEVVKNKIKLINSNTKVKAYKIRLNKKNFEKIINEYDYIVDGSDNFQTKFLLNDTCLKYKKNLFTGAVSKFDGHIFNFNFKKKTPCFRCFMPEIPRAENNCESEGIMSTLAGMAGTLQANEVINTIINPKNDLTGKMIVFNALTSNFRKIRLSRNSNCIKECTKR